jgi:hypothetical protein
VTVVDEPVVDEFEVDRDALASVRKTDGVALLETGHPDVVANVEDLVRMRAMRLRARDAPVIDLA